MSGSTATAVHAGNHTQRAVKGSSPVTYQSRARAERVARRRQARREAEELRKIHPVQKKETES